jgi:hypothetical protein
MIRIFLLAIFFVSNAYADLYDFGGHELEFKGDGDKVPPQCQIDVPSGSTTAFSVKWNCTDDTSPDNEIRTELWLLRHGAGHAIKLDEFLGFPAAVNINETVLNSATVAAGLPAAFRLVARDRAGVASISPYYTVQPQTNSLESCTLILNREATESEEDSTGTPATSLELNNVEINVNLTSSSAFRVSTKTAQVADPCEIADICDETDDGEVSFIATLQTDSGTVVVSPGNFQANLTGSASTSEGVNMTGSTTIDDIETDVILTCSK